MEAKTREENERSDITKTWIKKHLLVYTGAIRHPFILSIRDGSVDLSSFKTWLEQDYIFVRQFTSFVASVLIKASKESDDESDMEVVLGGLASLAEEISWFKTEASKRDVALSKTSVHETNQNYCRFLESLMLQEVEYAVAITAFWTIEVVYQQSFAQCLEDGNKTPSELEETCRRWGSQAFREYCGSLEKAVNRCLKKAPDNVVAKAEATFLRVLEHEVEFWNMSNRGT